MRVLGATREAAAVAKLLIRRGLDPQGDGLDAAASAQAPAAVIDARHPYAPAEDPTRYRAPYLRVLRAPWAPEPDDRWIEAPTIARMRRRLAPFRRVFVTLGAAYAEAFRDDAQRLYFFRDRGGDARPVGGAVRFVGGAGPFSVDGEIALMRRLEIDALATRNDGGRGAAPKVLAARALGLPVVMLSRPPTTGSFVASPRAAAAWAAAVWAAAQARASCDDGARR